MEGQLRAPSPLLPATYLDSRAVVHAYATTIHKAQGLTVDRTYIRADDRLTRETGYTALSRGRHDNHLYAVSSSTPEHDHGHLTRPDPLIELRRDLQRSNAQHLAVDDHSIGIEL